MPQRRKRTSGFEQNVIEVPAGILHAPHYDVNASYEENLGGIGYILAHEITHAFDNNGAQYDESGRLNNWWTAEDLGALACITQIASQRENIWISPLRSCL